MFILAMRNVIGLRVLLLLFRTLLGALHMNSAMESKLNHLHFFSSLIPIAGMMSSMTFVSVIVAKAFRL